MPKVIAHKTKSIARAFFISVMSLLLLIVLFTIFILISGYYFNLSTSMPIGFYKVSAPTNLKVGDDVVVCLPQSIGMEGLKHGYLNPGKCFNKYDYVVKELIAMPGDRVVLTNEQIIVNGKSYFAPVKTIDHLGLPLAAIPRGDYPNSLGFWLYGAHDPENSWDSRYWGNVNRESIVKVAQPVLTFH